MPQLLKETLKILQGFAVKNAEHCPMFVPADAEKLRVAVAEFILTSKRLYMSSYSDHILRKAILLIRILLYEKEVL